MTPAQKDTARNALGRSERDMAAMLVKRDASNLSENARPACRRRHCKVRIRIRSNRNGNKRNANEHANMRIVLLGNSWKARSRKMADNGFRPYCTQRDSLGFLQRGKDVARNPCGSYCNGISARCVLRVYADYEQPTNFWVRKFPRGGKRIAWNILMFCSVAASLVASIWVLWNKLGVWGPSILAVFAIAVAVSNRFLKKSSN